MQSQDLTQIDDRENAADQLDMFSDNQIPDLDSEMGATQPDYMR